MRPGSRPTLLPSGRQLLLLATLLAGSHLAVLPSYGWGALAVDSERYLKGAASLLAHQPLEGLQRWYASYAAVVAISESAGWGVKGVVWLQLLAAAACTVALYGLGCILGNSRTGVIAAALFAANSDIARWNLFVLSDSLYISLLPVAALAIWSVRRGKASRVVLALALLVLLALLRPSGWLLLPVAAIFWITRTPLTPRGRAAAIFGVLAAFVGWALTSTAGAAAGREPHLLFERGEVIWGYKEGRLAMPQASAVPGDTWGATLLYIKDHPFASTRLAATRLAHELLHARPFYSPLHNAACLLLVPVYVLAVRGLYLTRGQSLSALLAVLVASQLLLVALVCADWDGRYLLHVLPLVGVLAARGVSGRIDPRRPARLTPQNSPRTPPA